MIELQTLPKPAVARYPNRAARPKPAALLALLLIALLLIPTVYLIYHVQLAIYTRANTPIDSPMPRPVPLPIAVPAPPAGEPAVSVPAQPRFSQAPVPVPAPQPVQIQLSAASPDVLQPAAGASAELASMPIPSAGLP